MWNPGESITNTEDTIDSRDIIARIKELEEERQALVDAATEAVNAVDEADRSLPDWEETTDALGVDLDNALEDLHDWDGLDDGGEELTKLKAFAEEAEGYAADWQYGAQFIRESYFEEHARGMAEACCEMPPPTQGSNWPYCCIDWEKAADMLRQDYSGIEFDGETYYVQG